MIGGFVPGCDPCSVDDRTSFHHIKSNHIQVVGPSPEIPLTSIKSDPYVMHLSYGEVVTLYYSLAYDAHVTVAGRGAVRLEPKKPSRRRSPSRPESTRLRGWDRR